MDNIKISEFEENQFDLLTNSNRRRFSTKRKLTPIFHIIYTTKLTQVTIVMAFLYVTFFIVMMMMMKLIKLVYT